MQVARRLMEVADEIMVLEVELRIEKDHWDLLESLMV